MNDAQVFIVAVTLTGIAVCSALVATLMFLLCSDSSVRKGAVVRARIAFLTGCVLATAGVATCVHLNAQGSEQADEIVAAIEAETGAHITGQPHWLDMLNDGYASPDWAFLGARWDCTLSLSPKPTLACLPDPVEGPRVSPTDLKRAGESTDSATTSAPDRAAPAPDLPAGIHARTS